MAFKKVRPTPFRTGGLLFRQTPAENSSHHRKSTTSNRELAAPSTRRPSRCATQASACRFPPLQALAYLHPGKHLHSLVARQKKRGQQEAANSQFTPLTAGQLADLYAGKYPANYEEDFIPLKNISTSGIKKIRRAFDENGEE
jgi:hypothetical protein